MPLAPGRVSGFLRVSGIIHRLVESGLRYADSSLALAGPGDEGVREQLTEVRRLLLAMKEISDADIVREIIDS